MRGNLPRVLLRLAAWLVLISLAAAPAGAASGLVIDDADTVALPGNVHPLARPEFDAGPTDAALPMRRMILSLRPPAGRQAALERLLAEQQDPSSANYHRWLTPGEAGERFGPDPGEVEAAARWLRSHGFSVDEVAKGRGWINFSGPVSRVEQAFRVRMRNYLVDGGVRHANANDPAIPRGLAGLVAGIVSLHDFPRKTMHSGLGPPVPAHPAPGASLGGANYLSPADFATIYHVAPLYDAGIDGSGQSIAIVGRTHPSADNWSSFRSSMGLPVKAPQVIVNGTDPGDLGGGEDNEADLDVEWSGAVARNAAIVFVTSASTASTDGVDLSAQYIVDNNLAPVMSTSFGLCEGSLGSAERHFYNALWRQAAGQGISSFVATGDAGAAGCELGSDPSGTVRAVNGLASTPYNVAVGGTQFDEGTGSFWSPENGAANGSALGYIPEVAWNESGLSGGSGLWATGGGASAYYGKPSWQAAPGVPPDGRRDLPDVSLSAALHDGYLVQTQGGEYSIGGTSAASPSFAGLMALVLQKTGERQGNPNPRLYQLAAAQYGAGGVPVYHDTASGNNSVPGVTGYQSAAGYDLATGLGSVDASALVENWTPDFSVAAAPAVLSLPQRSSGSLVVTTAVLGNFGSAVALTASGLPSGVTASFAPGSIGAPGAGSAVLTLSADATPLPGGYQVTVTGAGGGLARSATIDLALVAVFDLTASVASGGGSITPASASVVSGGSASFVIGASPGYHLAGLTDNGAEVGSLASAGSYTIAGVTRGHAIVATFALDSFSVTALVSGGNGSVTPQNSSVSTGGSLTLAISPATGYQLATLTDNGAPVAALENPPGSFSYILLNVTLPHAVLASFAAAPVPPVPALPPFGLALFLVGAGVWGFGRGRRARDARHGSPGA